jgi:hypothetical protein
LLLGRRVQLKSYVIRQAYVGANEQGIRLESALAVWTASVGGETSNNRLMLFQVGGGGTWWG